MAATAALSAIAVGSTVYSGENQKGAQRDAEWMAEKQEKKQQEQMRLAEERKRREQQNEAEQVANRKRMSEKGDAALGTRSTLLTGPLGLPYSGGASAGKTLLGA